MIVFFYSHELFRYQFWQNIINNNYFDIDLDGQCIRMFSKMLKLIFVLWYQYIYWKTMALINYDRIRVMEYSTSFAYHKKNWVVCWSHWNISRFWNGQLISPLQAQHSQCNLTMSWEIVHLNLRKHLRLMQNLRSENYTNYFHFTFSIPAILSVLTNLHHNDVSHMFSVYVFIYIYHVHIRYIYIYTCVYII